MSTAYGLIFEGLASARLTEANDRPPDVVIRRTGAVPPRPEQHFSDVTAALPFPPFGHVTIDRASRTVLLPDHDDLSVELVVHPLLAGVASVFAAWDGREAIHGGAVAARSGAIGVLGARRAGKSTFLAAASMAGATVLADDLMVIEDGRVHRGPRCVDLRPSGARALQAQAAAFVRGRHRIALPPAPPELPLAGFVSLAWGTRHGLEPMAATERIQLLHDNLVLHPPQRPEGLLALSQLPMWRLTRPRDVAAMRTSVEAVLDL